MPVAGSLTATLVLRDSDGCPATTAQGVCRKVLLLADEAILGPERAPGVHAVLRGLPGPLRLVWRDDGLHWEAPGCRVASETKSAEHGGGLVCVPSSVRLEPEVPEEVSEAEFLRASLRQRGQMGLRLTWKKG